MPSYKEISKYHQGVMDEYNLRDKMTLSTEVYRCVWREDASRWLIFLRDVNTGREFTHECQILFAASGGLVEPQPCDIPGADTFNGSIFHSARWNHDVSLEGKNVAVIGNGCTFPLLTSEPTCPLTYFTRYGNTDRPSHCQPRQVSHAIYSVTTLGLSLGKHSLPFMVAVDLSQYSIDYAIAPFPSIFDGRE